MNFNEPGSNYPGYPSGNQNRPPSRMSAFFPLLFALMLALGVLLGYSIKPGGGAQVSGNGKLSYIINLIDKEYVDSVNQEDLLDKAISGMLEELDPHSVYMSARDVRTSNEELSGKFGGVGIQFLVQEDTLMVTHLVKDGPSEQKGLKPFDRILMVNKEKFYGKGITTEKVQSNLKGDVGTNVTLEIYRPSEKRKFKVDITRGVIPVSSIECAIMLANNTGLIKISQFGENTYLDFMKAARSLKEQGMQRLILDLRDNGGGYLQAAENIADQFLKNNMKIVYTQGRRQGRHDYIATDNGEFEDMPLVVLVNHNSASASEIVAGAIQDNDRGAIVGRRTFGKGLVQQQFAVGGNTDGSALRLTVSRYYTPSGRSIQRPYGHGIDYYQDFYDRYEKNELYRPDSSIFVDSLKYKTQVKGRIVYGGGGIMPDVFVPLDTSFKSPFYENVLRKNVINSFASHYSERNLDRIRAYKTYTNFYRQFVLDESLWNDFMKDCARKGVKTPTADEITRSRGWISNLIKAEIIRLAFGNEGYHYTRWNYDNEVKQAMMSFWK